MGTLLNVTSSDATFNEEANDVKFEATAGHRNVARPTCVPCIWKQMRSNKAVTRLAAGSNATEAQRVYGGRSGDQRRGERRVRLIAAGLVCFGRDGFAATTTRSIAAESGLTQRYFYESFTGIDDFFEQIVRELGEEWQANIAGAISAAPPRLEERLRGGVTAYLKGIHRKPYVARVMLIEAFTAAPTTSQVERFLAVMGELIEKTIADEFPSKSKVAADRDFLATGYVGAIHHVALRWVRSRFSEPLEKVVDVIIKLIVGSLSGYGTSKPGKDKAR
ncbi:TetR/AcrR family transcriptional regulator [Pendulispora rubella]|uniref:TetR/AcrR family transcriptional regulator n=1 Tax=Pendulispora rubella TaxID=2741070 RepID=A0ABZ2KPC8_9BACT